MSGQTILVFILCPFTEISPGDDKTAQAITRLILIAETIGDPGRTADRLNLNKTLNRSTPAERGKLFCFEPATLTQSSCRMWMLAAMIAGHVLEAGPRLCRLQYPGHHLVARTAHGQTSNVCLGAVLIPERGREFSHAPLLLADREDRRVLPTD